MNDIEIEKLIPGGQALGTLENGKKIMLWGTLPGEIVTKVRVTKEKSSYCEGVAEEIAQKSEQRIEPKDECYLATSPWQIMTYEYELEQKFAILEEIYHQAKINLNEAKINPVQTDGQDFHYRNKMEYALYYDHADEKIYPAFHGRGSHRKVPVVQSSLEHPEIWQRAVEIIDELNTRGEDARKYQSLLLRCDQSGNVSGGLYENHKPHQAFASLNDIIMDETYTYSPNGFFQINLPVYEMALREIKGWVKTDDVLDLYSGVGTIGLSVARNKNLVLVECDKSAYRELEANVEKVKLSSNSSAHITPVLAKSEDALEYIAPGQTVIVDPPRAGCMPEVIARFRIAEPKTIIYLSCNPVTQARDISKLLDIYNIVSVTPYNFFPRTPHLENLVILEHK